MFFGKIVVAYVVFDFLETLYYMLKVLLNICIIFLSLIQILPSLEDLIQHVNKLALVMFELIRSSIINLLKAFYDFIFIEFEYHLSLF